MKCIATKELQKLKNENKFFVVDMDINSIPSLYQFETATQRHSFQIPSLLKCPGFVCTIFSYFVS